MNRKVIRVTLAIVGALVVLTIASFRIPSGRATRREAAVWFKYISAADPVRQPFESLLGHAPVWLETGELIYIPKRTAEELWVLPPEERARNNQRLILRFSAAPLLCGGLSPAREVTIETTSGKNRISK